MDFEIVNKSSNSSCNIAIHEYLKCTSNVHNSYIDNIGIPKHEKHLRLLSSGTKHFYYLWVKRLFDIYNLSMLTFSSASHHPYHHDHHARHPPHGIGELRKSTFFFGGRNSTLPFGGKNSTLWLFFKSPKSSAHASCAWRHIFYLGFLWMTRPLCSRVNTCAHACT